VSTLGLKKRCTSRFRKKESEGPSRRPCDELEGTDSNNARGKTDLQEEKTPHPTKRLPLETETSVSKMENSTSGFRDFGGTINETDICRRVGCHPRATI